MGMAWWGHGKEPESEVKAGADQTVAAVRMTWVSKVTILKPIAELGIACADYQDRTFGNLQCKRIECDEI